MRGVKIKDENIFKLVCLKENAAKIDLPCPGSKACNKPKTKVAVYANIPFIIFLNYP